MEEVSAKPVFEYVTPEVAAERLNPAIKPTDAKWREVHDKFTLLLNDKDKTIQQILKENFTRHEARLFVPSDRPEVKELQDSHTERYKVVREGRFKNVEPTLSVKMTMLYFGVPVEPMDSPLDEIAAFLDPREPEGPIFEIAPPLHFLTAHKHRNWGDDALRAREDRIQPVPIRRNLAPTLSLRGGAAGEEEPQDLVDTIDYVPAGEEAVDPSDDWVNLYGVQGVIPFVPEKWRSFSAAVRQLLSLRFADARARHFVFVHFDKRTHQVLNHVKEPLPLTKDSPVVKFIQKHCESEWHDKDCCAFYVKEVTDGRRDYVWEPQSGQFKADLAKISYPVFDKTRDPEQKIVRYAYLAFPRVKEKEKFSIDGFNPDHFDAHFHTAVEVLTGRPKGSFLHGVYSLVDENGPKPTTLGISDYAQNLRERGFYFNYQGSYGGMVLKPTLWPLLHPLSNPKGSWALHAAPMEKNQIAFVLPNTYLEVHPMVERQDVTGSGPWSGAHALIWSLVNKRPLEQNETRPLDKQVRLLPGGTALGKVIDRKEEGLLYPCPPGKDSAAELAKFLDKLVDSGAEPFVLIHRIYKPGMAKFLPRWWKNPVKSQCVDMPPLGSSLKDFRDSVRALCEAAKYNGQYNPEADTVILESQHALSNGRYEFSHLVVTPQTTEDDWYRIRARITTNVVQVKVQSDRVKDWKASISKSNTWGARISSGQSHWEPVDDVTLKRNVRAVELEKNPARLTDAPPQRRGPGRGYRFGRDDNDVNVGESAGGEDEFSWPPERPRSPNPIDSDERFSSYAVQPSIFDNYDKFQWINGQMVLNRAPKIPINAPPQEPILRTTSSVPMVSKGILTPSEQGRLQDDFWELRNMMLKRTAKCPYKGCDFACRLDKKGDMHVHLAESHRTESCPFCPSPLWEFWDQTQRRDHLRTEHAAKLAGILGVPVPEPANAAGVEELAEGPPRKRTFTAAFSGYRARRPGDPSLMAELRGQAVSRTGTTPTGQRYRPKDRLRRLEHPLTNWYDHRGRVQYKDPCVRCHIVACPRPDLEKLDAHDVYEHFDTLHPVAMSMCPFCDLPFEVSTKDDGAAGSKNRRPRDEIILHLDCHVNSLWDDLAARAPSASRSQQTESSQAPEVASRDEDRVFQIIRKCPFYSECGAVVQWMTPEQLRRHIRTEHAKDVHPPPREASSLHGSFDRAQDDPNEHSGSAVPKSALKKASRAAKTPLKPLPRPKTTRTPAASASASASEDSSRSTSTSKTATSRGRNVKKTPGSKLRSVQASIELTDETSEDQRSTGGTRALSPDWDEVLDPEVDDFLPDEGMYCSRCLRKVPKYPGGNNDSSEMTTAEQMERHMAKDGCCQIRRGLGEPKSKLPNRSGWLPSSLRDLGKIKSKFLKDYPAYVNTIYPTNKSDNNSSKWRSDPNNPDNKDAWGAPWPAVQGMPFPSISVTVEEATASSRSKKTPFKGKVFDPNYKHQGEADSDDDSDLDVDDNIDLQGSNRKRKRAKGPKNPLDPNYRFQKQDDPDDGLEPEFDDTKEFLESSPRLEDLAESGKGKRKRANTATEEPEAGPSQKKPKPSAAPREALKTPAKPLKPKPTPKTKGKAKTSAQSSAVPSRASSRQRAAREKSVASSKQGS